MNMPHYKEVALNFNRSGTKYNPPSDWVSPVKQAWKTINKGITKFTVIPQMIRRKLKPRKSRAARRYDDHFTLTKRLHAVKFRGKGDRLTNQQRFEKNRRER